MRKKQPDVVNPNDPYFKSSKGILGRLLAEENVVITYDRTAPTAYADMKNRKVVLPHWDSFRHMPAYKDIADELITFLLGHETSHLKHSPSDIIERESALLESKGADKKNSKYFHSVVNVVEDHRIDKLARRYYPGIRPIYRKAYKFLLDSGINKIKPDDPGVSLANRINLESKWGTDLEVPFSESEQEVLQKVKTAVTFEDVLEVSWEIFSRDLEAEKLSQSNPDDIIDNEGEIDYDKLSDMIENMDTSGDGNSSNEDGGSLSSDPSGDPVEFDPSKLSDKAQDKLKELKENLESNEGSSDSSDSSTDGGDDSKELSDSGDASDSGESGPETDSDSSSTDGPSEDTDASDDSSGGPSEHTDASGDSSDEVSGAEGNTKPEPTMGEINSQKALSSVLNDMAEDANRHHIGYNSRSETKTVKFLQFSPQQLDRFIVDWKTGLKNRRKFYSSVKSTQQSMLKYGRRIINPFVMKLVSSFERKKSGIILNHRSNNLTGDLDFNRLHQYKVSDDLFLRRTKTPDGKNHGFIFFIDFSGSMGNMIFDVVAQLMVLMDFCRRLNIPFSVYSFGPIDHKSMSFSSISRGTSRSEWDSLPKFITNDTSFGMNELFSSKMSVADYNEMLGYILIGLGYKKSILSAQGSSTLNGIKYNHSIFSGDILGSTPLAETMYLSTDLAHYFKLQHKVDVMNVVVLTDGESSTGLTTGSSYNEAYENYSVMAYEPYTRMLIPWNLVYNQHIDLLAHKTRLVTGANVIHLYLSNSRRHRTEAEDNPGMGFTDMLNLSAFNGVSRSRGSKYYDDPFYSFSREHRAKHFDLIETFTDIISKEENII